MWQIGAKRAFDWFVTCCDPKLCSQLFGSSRFRTSSWLGLLENGFFPDPGGCLLHCSVSFLGGAGLSQPSHKAHLYRFYFRLLNPLDGPLRFGVLCSSADFFLLTSWGAKPCCHLILTCIGAVLGMERGVVRSLAKERKCCPKLTVLFVLFLKTLGLLLPHTHTFPFS